MNTVSTKTNAAFLLTDQSKRAKSSKLEVQSSRELPSSKPQGSKVRVFPRFFDPGGLRFGAGFELCSLSFELRRADSHWNVEETKFATRCMPDAVQLRRAPAFAPLHRFINCLMAEASDRTE